MAWEDTPGIPQGRTEEEIQDCTEDQHFVHPELTEPGKERGDSGRNCGVIPAGFALEEGSLLGLLGLCWQRIGVRFSPQVPGESLGVLSTPGTRQNFSIVSLCCLAASISISICTEGYSYPLNRQTELHKVKASPLIKVTVKQSSLFWGFCHFSRNYGFYLKTTWKLSLSQSSKGT